METTQENQEITILLETDTDYREAIAALDEQIKVSQKLWNSVETLARAIDKYEQDNNIEQIQDDN